MAITLKKLNEQVMVITGASSGIGLTTARLAAQSGARLVLAARNEEALKKLTYEINSAGGEAFYVVADVGREGDVKKIAAEAINQFGNFDTWVNNAGISIYGKMEDIPMEDFRRLFDTNFWGVVSGSLVAARHLRLTGGAIINVGSILSDRAIPLQGMYCASKHAVKGFTDALRMELEADGAPISVSLVKPASIDTPYRQHARNYMGVEAKNPPPVYAPETAADAILHCAEHPTRDVYVGGAGKAYSFLTEYTPRATDKIMEATLIDIQKTDQPLIWNAKEGLYESHDDELAERGGYPGHVAESSIYTKASLHPIITGAATGVALAALGAGIAYLASHRNERTH